LSRRSNRDAELRVALIAGTLGCGGAEKQLLYQLDALRASDVAVRVFCLTRGEAYEEAVRALGVPLQWAGPATHPVSRLRALMRAIGTFQPHVVSAAHFFVNLYVVATARRTGAVELGSVRSDGFLDVECCGRWGYPLLRAPRAVIVNSAAATRNVATLGVHRDAIYLLPNVIDLHAFDRAFEAARERAVRSGPVAVAVGRLTAVKRYDRFLTALREARERVPGLRGEIVGDGPSRPALEDQARSLGLLPDGVTFVGAREDVPAQLRGAAMLVSCSDHEGFPNVLLEAMAGRVPVIATPAGECAALIRDGWNGYVVPFDPPSVLAEAMVRIALSPSLGRQLGQAGRGLVERDYTADSLGPRMLEIYRAAAVRQHRAPALAALTRCHERPDRVASIPAPAVPDDFPVI